MKLLKLPLFADFLREGSVFVFVIPSPGLVVPKNLTFPVPLEYGHDMANPIPDLTWSERGIRATLSFGAIPFETFVPWESVIAMKPKGQKALVAWTSLTVAYQPIVDATVLQETPPPIPQGPRLSIVK